jgi:hypothetical protein
LVAALNDSPYGSLDAIDLHENWYRNYRTFHQKKKETTISYHKSREELIDSAVRNIDEVIYLFIFCYYFIFAIITFFPTHYFT